MYLVYLQSNNPFLLDNLGTLLNQIMSSNDKINNNINHVIRILEKNNTAKKYNISEEDLENIKDNIENIINGPNHTIEYKNKNDIFRLTWDPEAKQFIGYYQNFITLSFDETYEQLQALLKFEPKCDFICTTHDMVYYNSGVYKENKTIFNKMLHAMLSNEKNFIRTFVRNNNNISISIMGTASYEYKKIGNKYKWESRILESYDPRDNITRMVKLLIDKYKKIYK